MAEEDVLASVARVLSRCCLVVLEGVETGGALQEAAGGGRAEACHLHKPPFPRPLCVLVPTFARGATLNPATQPPSPPSHAATRCPDTHCVNQVCQRSAGHVAAAPTSSACGSKPILSSKLTLKLGGWRVHMGAAHKPRSINDCGPTGPAAAAPSPCHRIYHFRSKVGWPCGSRLILM